MNMNPECLRLPIVCDGCGGLGEIRTRRASPEATCDLEECPDCRGNGTRYVTLDPGDPWAILRALRAFPPVDATADEGASLDGCDAVDALGALRAFLDIALAQAPTSAFPR